MKFDVLIFGGGIAGLWTLDCLRGAGYQAALLESRALGSGQSVQAQGIIHGGGKYGLRRVSDLASMRAIRAMPERWRAHLRGEAAPDLSRATVLSEHCDLWIPRGGLMRRLSALALFPLVRHARVLHSAPQSLQRAQWPTVLADSALRVERMMEPVVDTRSVLDAMRSVHAPWTGLYAPEALRVDPSGSLDVGAGEISARMIVLCAGRGNGALLERLGARGVAMQERPLQMLLLRGRLPHLFGHCVDGGRTRLTVTSAQDDAGRTIWQLGGEIAERHLQADEAEHFAAGRRELASTLPGLALSGLELARYAAVRAESATTDGRRPSGVDLVAANENLLAAWPTKFALAPLLAEEILERVRERLGAPTASAGDGLGLPRPELAAFPWQEALRWQAID